MKSIMNKTFGLMVIGAAMLAACESRTKTDPDAPAAASPAAPDTAVSTNSTTALQISSSDSLQTGIDSIAKNYPDIHISNDSGVVTVSGSLAKDRLPVLLTSLHALHPKKLNNNIRLK